MLRKQLFSVNDTSIYCSNCGDKGHNNKLCKKPIQSYGVVLYRDIEDEIEYLMVCNKDSYGYLQFVRGRYGKYDLHYIKNLFTEMTKTELNKLEIMSFDELWTDLWSEDKFKLSSSYHSRDKEFDKIKYNMLKSGYDIFGSIITLKDLIDEVKDKAWIDPEWGFPKGRRSNRETNKECALREFVEETGISIENLEIDNDFNFISEVFKGSDNVMYEHSYILAKYKGYEEPKIDKSNKTQITEISQIKFLKYEECIEKMRHTMEWRKTLLSDINKYILKEEDESEIVNTFEFIE